MVLDLTEEELFHFLDGRFGGNVIIFEVVMSSSVHVDDKKNDNLILVEAPTQESDGTKLTAEKEYSKNFT